MTPDPRLVEAMAEARRAGYSASSRADDRIVGRFLSDPRTVAWLAERRHVIGCAPLATIDPTQCVNGWERHLAEARAILGVEP